MQIWKDILNVLPHLITPPPSSLDITHGVQYSRSLRESPKSNDRDEGLPYDKPLFKGYHDCSSLCLLLVLFAF
jgi:hypothetical protein